ncbi:MAG TPA: hypothetical protein VM582_04015 [Candidatus Thermoplasmatota archaeon]|nr:hypothetical protein [Candidatus Thermoplasmatota archaeon]
MERRRALLLVASLLLLALGAALSFAPMYAPRPSAPPQMVGTYWYLGLPSALAGVALLVVALRPPRARAG